MRARCMASPSEGVSRHSVQCAACIHGGATLARVPCQGVTLTQLNSVSIC